MAYSHTHLSIKITPVRGRKRGVDKTVRHHETCKLDPGKKKTYLKGGSEAPVDIVTGAAEPSLEFKCSSAKEAWEIYEHLSGAPATITLVWKRPGEQGRNVFKCVLAELENGGGFDTSADNGPADTLKFKMRDIELNGRSIYDQAA